jgi:hypothetical protein
MIIRQFLTENFIQGGQEGGPGSSVFWADFFFAKKSTFDPGNGL